jgi:hypothetical protein
VVLRLRSLSFIIKFIRHISTTQTQIQSTFLQDLRDPDSLSEFPACLMLYLSLTSSIRIPIRRLARSGAVLTETRLIGSSVRVVDGVLVDMMNRRDADADGREACARRSSLGWLLIRCFRAVNIAGRRSTILHSWKLYLELTFVSAEVLGRLVPTGEAGSDPRHE